MSKRLLMPRSWCAFDAADYWLTQARLTLVDAVCGPEPPTVADEMRETTRERLGEAFPDIVISMKR
jgi:hypothetical protein